MNSKQALWSLLQFLVWACLASTSPLPDADLLFNSTFPDYSTHGDWFPSLSKRAPGDSLDDYICKGQLLLSRMAADHGMVEQSSFDDYGDVAKYGWDLKNSDPPGERVLPARSVLSYLQISQNSDDWTVIMDVHDKHYNIDPSEGGRNNAYLPTQGEYECFVSPKYGTFVITRAYSPMYFIKISPVFEGVDPSSLIPHPMLMQWSDLSFLEWERQCEADNVDTDFLKFFIVWDIRNTETINAVEQVLAVAGSSMDALPVWPGMTFDTTTPLGKALLATPNAAGPCWFLLQHKDQLELKTISHVTLFKEPEHHFSMVLVVADA
ncbi:MAG: hypothetical protein M1820_009038 [Bogoriella megaspora]|nr:MAG: hypothetical protein M1820_009038 [Bogoriella megaspora]